VSLRDRLVDAVASLPVLASRHARLVLVAYLLVSAAMFGGLTQLAFQDNIIDLLPEDNVHTQSARQKEEEFPQQAFVTPVNLVIDEGKWAEANEQLPNRRTEERPGNVTDEVYVRGVNEFNRYLLREVDAARWNISLDSYVNLINYTNSGRCAWAEQDLCAERPDPDAFSMPGRDPEGEERYATNWRTIQELAPGAIVALVGPEWNATRTTMMFDPGPDTTSKELGAEIIRGVEGYKEWAPENARWDVFDLEASHVGLGIPPIDAHSSALAEEDLGRLAPLVGGFIVLALYAAFRNGRSLAVAGGGLGLGALWSFGAMGYLGIPLNTVNLALVPLILGDGIDYGIHVVNSYLEGRNRGLDDEAAFAEAGLEAGVPLFIATVTTVSGLLLLLASPSPLMGQVGLVFALGVTVVFVLSLTFIPAALTVLGTEGLETSFTETTLVPRIAQGVARHWKPVAALVVLLTAASLVTGSQVETLMFGSPKVNFPEGDYMRENIEKENLYMRGSGDQEYAATFVNFHGDVTDPAFHDYLRNATRELEDTDLVRDNSSVGVDFVIGTWQQLEGGTTGAAVPTAREEAQPGSTYPETREEMNATLDEIFASPLSTYASLFINDPDRDITVVLMELRSPETLDATEDIWNRLGATLDEINAEHDKPDDVQVRMTGTLTFAYLLATEVLPWVWYVGIAGFVAVVSLVAFFTRAWRPTLAVAALMGLTTTWWIGLLPLVGIQLSLVLMLPMVFIMSIGSDYAVHLAWNIDRADETASEVMATTGKGVLFSAVTDGGAFLLFVFMQSLLMRDAMVSTSVAILTIFLCTLLVLPLFYREAFLEDAEAPEAADAAEAPLGEPA
jgi:predicted RND superfamily exporter protein